MSKPAKSTYSDGLYQVSGITGPADATVFEINVGHGVFNGKNIFKIGEINYGDTDLKNQIEEIIITDIYKEGAGVHPGITIYKNAFSSFPKLKKITYNGNVNSGPTEIDGFVFSGDQPLEEVNFAGMNAATLPSQFFAGLSTLNSVILPDSLESISKQLFYGSSIQTITIPRTVKKIEDNAFAQSNLTTLTINSTEITTEGDPFNGIRHKITEVKIPNLEIIPKEFFHDMNISSIDLSNACTKIGPGAFFQCTKLTSIDLKNVTVIQNSAFTYCVGLNEVIGLENVKELGFEAFVSVPLKNTTCLNFESIETIGYGCFFYCGVKKVSFGSYLSSLGEGVFLSSDVEEVDLSKCTNLTGLSFCMFDSCYKLTSVKLSESIKRIGARAFYGCNELNTSGFNWSNFSVIGMDAFTGTEVYSNESNWKDGILYINGCILESKLDSTKTSLTASDIQARVIADGALANYTSLTSISIDDSTESIGNSSFFNNYKVLSLSYAGTKEEWSKILLGHKWNYNIPAFTVNCIDDNVIIRNPESHHLWYSTTDGEQAALANDAYTQNWYDGLGDVDLSNGSWNWLSTNSETSLFVEQTLKSVILPEDIHYIDLYVFKNNKSLLSINLENAWEIMKEAFYGCESLKEVSLPICTSIKENAFYGCIGLKNLTVNNLSIFDDTVFQNTGLTTQNTEAIIKLLYPGKTGFFDTKEFFRANSSLYRTGITADRIIIGSDNIERTQLILDKEGTVADYAFAYCTNLTSIKFGDEITTIGKSVFDNCTSLESIHFGKNCSIGKIDSDYWSISFIPTLKIITVDQGNKTLQILKDAGVTFLIKLDSNPNTKTVMAVCLGISNYAKLPYYRIASNIFKGCDNLETVVLESSLIEESAFSNCSSLSKVYFNTSPDSIGNNAFKDCTSLNFISYSGTPAEWNAIPKGTDWNHNVPATYVQCKGGQQVPL